MGLSSLPHLQSSILNYVFASMYLESITDSTLIFHVKRLPGYKLSVQYFKENHNYSSTKVTAIGGAVKSGNFACKKVDTEPLLVRQHSKYSIL